MEYSYNIKSIWKWIVIYLLVGAIAYGLIYYLFFYNKGGYNQNSQYPISNNQTQNSETSDWKTYTDQDFGVSFQYPKECSPKVLSHLYATDPSNFYNNIDFPNCKSGVGYVSMGYHFDKNVNRNLTFQEMVNLYENPKGGKVLNKETIILDGREGIKILSKSTSDPRVYNEVVLVSVNVKDVILTVSRSYSIDNSLGDFNDFLSTFKFTK